MKTLFRALVATFLLGIPAGAHHSVATFFKLDETIEIKGVVKEFRLVNPHMRLQIEVTTPKGEKELWTVTGGVTGDLRAAGWTPTSVTPGEVVTISGPPARNPAAKGMYARKLVKADGTALQQQVRD